MRDGSREKLTSPAVRGLYRVSYDKMIQSRLVVLDPTEVLAAPRAAPRTTATERASGRASVDVSGETALALVSLLALELLLRVLRYRGARRAISGVSIRPAMRSTRSRRTPLDRFGRL